MLLLIMFNENMVYLQQKEGTDAHHHPDQPIASCLTTQPYTTLGTLYIMNVMTITSLLALSKPIVRMVSGQLHLLVLVSNQLPLELR